MPYINIESKIYDFTSGVNREAPGDIRPGVPEHASLRQGWGPWQNVSTCVKVDSLIKGPFALSR